MNHTSDALEELYEGVVARERKSKQRIIAFSLIPVFVGITWLMYTWLQVNELKKLSNEYQRMIDQNKRTLESSAHQIDSLKSELSFYTHFVNSTLNIGWHELKPISAYNGAVGQLFSDIIRLKEEGVTFNINGQSPQAGFSSSSMIAFVLKKEGLLESEILSSAVIKNQLKKVRTDEMKHGDIIVYTGGYYMLNIDISESHYRDELKKSNFCIGMTPLGIHALNLDFDTIKEVYRPHYRN